jgi:hypothetical protein
MSRKHFEELARQIREISNMEARLYAALAVCKAARQFNNRFNQQRFLDACEV